ncbi:hypothetical protein [Chelatococcus asaccharovorans]|uniref:hypothetical protein n=1 Tax=Chelatococcus asaccharovorans TaxID=28210 RepID=UPI001FE09D0E|nr:hypothetical protein [Chelatococcus asaccharovorans]
MIKEIAEIGVVPTNGNSAVIDLLTAICFNMSFEWLSALKTGDPLVSQKSVRRRHAEKKGINPVRLKGGNISACVREELDAARIWVQAITFVSTSTSSASFGTAFEILGGEMNGASSPMKPVSL